MTDDQIDKLAAYLFTNTAGQVADRLVLTSKLGSELGTLSPAGMRNRIKESLGYTTSPGSISCVAIRIEPVAGAMVKEGIASALQLAERLGYNVKIKINQVDLLIRPDEGPDRVEREYERMSNLTSSPRLVRYVPETRLRAWATNHDPLVMAAIEDFLSEESKP